MVRLACHKRNQKVIVRPEPLDRLRRALSKDLISASIEMDLVEE